jgi:hypothetical protein
MVASKNHIQTLGLLNRGRNNHTFHSTLIQIGLEILHLEKLPSTFKDQLDSHTLKVNIGIILVLRKGNLLIVYSKVSLLLLDNFLIPSTVDGIVFDEVSSGFDRAKIVDVHNFQGRIIPCITKDKPSDASESVHCDFDHVVSLML